MSTSLKDIRANAWTGSYKWPEPNYYIHSHAINIGRANKGPELKEVGLKQQFNKYKGQALQAVKQQYRNLFQQSIIKTNMSQSALDLLDYAMQKDDKMTALTHQIGSALSQALTTEIRKGEGSTKDKMATLMDKKKEAIKKMKEASNTLDTLNDIIDIYIKVCDLLMNKKLRQYLMIGLNAAKSGGSVNKVGENLLAVLNTVKKEIDKHGNLYTKNQIQQILLVMEEMRGLSISLAKYPNDKNPFSQDGIKKMFLRVFENGFSEAISGDIASTARFQVNKTVDTHFSGKERYRIVYYDEFGENPTVKQTSGSLMGKADLTFKNVKVTLTKASGKTEDIYINIGISDKFYSTLPFGNEAYPEDQPVKMSGGGAGKLEDMLISAFGNDERLLYLSYNTLAFGTLLPAAVQSLQDIVATRGIVNLFSSRGGSKDFAQYIFVNNQIVSIWDIITGASTFLGKTASADPVSQLVILSTSSKTTSEGKEKQRRVIVQDEAKKIPKTEEEQKARIITINHHIKNIYIKAQLDLAALRKQLEARYKR